MTPILATAVLLWQLVTGPIPTVGISTTGIIERLPDTATAVTGWATWYDVAPGHAAAGPALRTGDWRGRSVTVCAGGQCVTTRLTDWCACGRRNGMPTLIDLARADFARLASPSRGVIRVTVSSGGEPSSTLPPTSTSEGEGS